MRFINKSDSRRKICRKPQRTIETTERTLSSKGKFSSFSLKVHDDVTGWSDANVAQRRTSETLRSEPGLNDGLVDT